MELVCKTKFEKAWIVTSVFVMVTHTMLADARSDYSSLGAVLGEWLELLMVMSSFPLGGLMALALNILLFWCDDCSNVQFLLGWPTLLLAGYIQWFWILPEFLQSRKLTLLDLKRPLQATSGKDSPVACETPPVRLSTTPVSTSTTPAPLSNALPGHYAAPLPAFDAAAFAPALAEFDESGLTALDRVFQTPPAAPAHPAASPVEMIFPHVS